jgi:hypothetical protein
MEKSSQSKAESEEIWLSSFFFIFDELLGRDITSKWLDSSECPSLEDIKEDETPFDPEIELTNWQKKDRLRHLRRNFVVSA